MVQSSLMPGMPTVLKLIVLSHQGRKPVLQSQWGESHERSSGGYKLGGQRGGYSVEKIWHMKGEEQEERCSGQVYYFVLPCLPWLVL